MIDLEIEDYVDAFAALRAVLDSALSHGLLTSSTYVNLKAFLADNELLWNALIEEEYFD